LNQTSPFQGEVARRRRAGRGHPMRRKMRPPSGLASLGHPPPFRGREMQIALPLIAGGFGGRLKPLLASFGLEPLVQIGVDRLHQHVDLAVKEMIGAGDNLLLDDDALLRF